MNKMLYIIATTALLASTAPAAEKPWKVYTEWPFDAAEAKRRQQETADAMGIPVEKTVVIGKDRDNGKPVMMDFMLIPAGKFVMGTPEPVKPIRPVMDWRLGRIVQSGGFVLLASLIVLIGYRARREKRWPQFSLAGLVLLLIAASAILMGRKMERQMEVYNKEMTRYIHLMPKFGLARLRGETPAHDVTISQPFYIGKTEVTWLHWRGVLNNSSSLRNDNSPLVEAWWSLIENFLTRMNQRSGNNSMRLPNEAEWEYASRAGTETRFCYGDDMNDLGAYAWFADNSNGRLHPVGGKRANSWGLHDMHGNAAEWCRDWYDENYYKYSPNSDPTGPTSGVSRVLRDWEATGSASRTAFRPERNSKNVGFRVVLSAIPTTP